jgi:hypothetical protein
MPTEFELIERSVDLSQPLNLFRVDIAGQQFFYTSDPFDVEYLGDIYKEGNVRYEGYDDGSDPNKAQIRFYIGIDTELAQMLLGGIPTEIIYWTAFRKQREYGSAEMFWSGEVLGEAANEEGIYLVSADATQSQKRNGMTLRWQLLCGYGIYEENTCMASRSFRRVDVPSVVATPSTMFSPLLLPAHLIPAGKMVADHEENWFVGGYAEYDDNITNTTARKTIISYDHLTGTVGLHPNTTGYEADTPVSFFPGCKRNTEDCDVKHQNLRRHGGSPFLPRKNIFEPGELPW